MGLTVATAAVAARGRTLMGQGTLEAPCQRCLPTPQQPFHHPWRCEVKALELPPTTAMLLQHIGLLIMLLWLWLAVAEVEAAAEEACPCCLTMTCMEVPPR